MARPRSRSTKNKLHNLYAADVTVGWFVVRLVSYSEGEQGVAEGTMLRVVDERGHPAGYQLVARKETTGEELPSQPTAIALTRKEAEALAGALGRSRTASMHPDDPRRLERRNKKGVLLPAEDFVERALAKVKAWNEVR
jgi:hypothetical protein